MEIIDVFTYNGEKEILNLHLGVLGDTVSRFFIVEFDKTFSGKDKPFFFEEHSYIAEHWKDKVEYFKFTEDFYNKYIPLAESSPNVPTGGPEHWRREFCQKECIADALEGTDSDSLCFIGDVDEIWNPSLAKKTIPHPIKLKLKVYTYYLNNRSNEQFWGTLCASYKDIRGKCVNHLRTQTEKTVTDMGWHFTSMGGYFELYRKLDSSYTRDSYWTPDVEENLEQRMKDNKDFLGRPFVYEKDATEWPQYLKDNYPKYGHLIK